VAVEDQIVTLLTSDPGVAAIVGARVYAMPAPQATASPFLTYQIISVNRVGQTYDARSSHDVTGLQIDCWMESGATTSQYSRYSKVAELARAVRTALDRKGLAGEDTVDLIRWDGWTDFNTPDETRRTLEFTLVVKGT
jgi:uncharacterized protein DUF3168